MKKVKEIIGLQNEVVDKTQSLPTEKEDKSYLARHAGLQTVQTSMKGILGENSIIKRKKLLGE